MFLKLIFKGNIVFGTLSRKRERGKDGANPSYGWCGSDNVGGISAIARNPPNQNSFLKFLNNFY